MIINKDDAKAIAEHFGLIDGDDKPNNAIALRKEMNAKIKAIKEWYMALVKAVQDDCEHEWRGVNTSYPNQYGHGVKYRRCVKCASHKNEDIK